MLTVKIHPTRCKLHTSPHGFTENFNLWRIAEWLPPRSKWSPQRNYLRINCLTYYWITDTHW